MITNITGNINNSTGFESLYNIPINSVYPNLDASFRRMFNLFNKKCDSEIAAYSTCLGNSDWKENPTQYIPTQKRVDCWKTWSLMKSCGRKYLGDGFALKLEISRQLENTLSEKQIEDQNIAHYNKMMNNQLTYLKEDSPVEGEEEE